MMTILTTTALLLALALALGASVASYLTALRTSASAADQANQRTQP